MGERSEVIPAPVPDGRNEPVGTATPQDGTPPGPLDHLLPGFRAHLALERSRSEHTVRSYVADVADLAN